MRRLKGFVLLVHPVPILAVCAVGLLLGLSIAATPAEFERLALALAAIFFSQLLVGATNDWCDLPQDKISQPWKPLVAEMVSARDVLAFVVVDTLLLLSMALWLAPPVIAGVAVGTFAGLAHNFWTKGTRFDWLAYLLGFAALPVTVWLALQRWKPEQAFILVPAAFLLIAVLLARDVPDIAGDSDAGKKGLAVRLGAKQSIRAICVCLSLAGAAAWVVLRFVAVNRSLWFIGLGIYFLIVLFTIYRYAVRSDNAGLRSNFRLTILCAVLLVGTCLFALNV
jgi:4-hydroxybenzoate polyprenyltransferase